MYISLYTQNMKYNVYFDVIFLLNSILSSFQYFTKLLTFLSYFTHLPYHHIFRNYTAHVTDSLVKVLFCYDDYDTFRSCFNREKRRFTGQNSQSANHFTRMNKENCSLQDKVTIITDKVIICDRIIFELNFNLKT